MASIQITKSTQDTFLPDSDFVEQSQCVLCRQLMTYYGERRFKASKFEYTAKKGCIICKVVRAAVETFVIDSEQRESCLVSLSGILCLYLPPNKTRMPLDMFCLPSATCPWDDIDRKNNLSPTTRSLQSWLQAQQWLETCYNEHDKCLPQTETLPTRLLDLNVIGSRDIRLFNTSDIKMTGTAWTQNFRYACLSHCWGTIGCAVKTMTWNIRGHNKLIPWSKLPATYKDAITFLRWLGIRYLWIDSLCIIQNDTEDWLKESAMMASVYSGSYITIAATGAENNEAGQFVERDLTVAKVPCPYGDSESFDLYLRKPLSHDLFWQAESFLIQDPEEDPRLPLLSRGWVFQERLLSPRVLHFTRDELVWECMQCSKCECGTSRHGEGLVKADLSKALITSNLITADINRFWHVIVQGYSSKSLTYKKDKLPALSGLAKKFQQLKKGAEYMAGLWRDNLALDLLWFVMPKARNAMPRNSLPSWSWASLNEEIGYYCIDHTDKVALEILEAKCDLLSLDPTGDVGSCEIILRGMIEPLKNLTPWEPGAVVSIIVTPFEEVPVNEIGYKIALGDQPSVEFEVDIYWDKRLSTFDGVYLLKVSSVEWAVTSTSSVESAVRFIVLCKADGEPKDRFSRIGMGNWRRRAGIGPGIDSLGQYPFAESIAQTITLV